jgi:hypothetical protein
MKVYGVFVVNDFNPELSSLHTSKEKAEVALKAYIDRYYGSFDADIDFRHVSVKELEVH